MARRRNNCKGEWLLLLANTLADFDEAVCHDGGHANEIVDRTEAASGEVALLRGVVSYQGARIYTARYNACRALRA